jgi:hypothetical protein
VGDAQFEELVRAGVLEPGTEPADAVSRPAV